VTHQVQALTRSLGHPVFHSGRRTLELTPVGAAVHERAGRILALVGETGDLLDDITGLRTGSVRVAGDTTVGIYVLPDALASFRDQHPNIELSLEVVNRRKVRELLLSGDADIGVAGRLWEDELLQAEPLMENELMCFSAPDHPLVNQEPLQPADLLKGPLLLRELGSGTRESAEDILRAHGVEPKPAMQLASNGALKRAVARGLGVTVLSTHAVTLELKLGLLHPLRTNGFPVKRMWHVVWARERVLSPAAQAFRQHLQSPEWRIGLTAPLATD
jgi:DNA-binding transcriptional LysR family regulator